MNKTQWSLVYSLTLLIDLRRGKTEAGAPMTYEDFVQGIRFRDIDPSHKSVSVSFDFDSKETLDRMKIALKFIDCFLAILPERQEEYFNLLFPILSVPRMSTYANGVIISRTVEEMAPGAAYVNVGLWHGYSLLAGMLEHGDRRVVGVDNFSMFGGPKASAIKLFEKHKGADHALHDMDYLDYFAGVHEGDIGFYFYDGPHDYENQLRGLTIAEPYFTPDCCIMVDDTNWDEPRRATTDFIARSANDYEIVLDRRTAWNGHPTFWNGMMLFRRTS